MKKDLTKGVPLKVLLRFALPMLLANLFQQVYNLTDSVVVGQYVGTDALGAVGLSFSVFFLLVSVSQGLGIGCSVVISQFYGARKYREVVSSIWTCLISFFILGLICSVFGQFIIHPVLNLLNCPPEIYNYSVDYLTYIFAGCVFTFMYNTVSSIFISLGDSKTSTIFLIIAALLNVVLDLHFVINLNMGVAGVAIATMIAQAIASALSTVFLIKRLKDINMEKPKYFDFGLLRKMLRVAIPSVLQQSMVSLSILAVQGLVNSFGNDFVAAYTAASKLDSLAMMPMFSIANAMSTFSAQNIGAKEIGRIKEAYKGSLIFSVIFCLIISLLVFLFGHQMIGLFVKSGASERVLIMGSEYLQTVSIFYFLMSILFITNGVIKGSGDMFAFMFSSFTNLGSRIIFAYILSYFIGYYGIFFAIPIGWLLGSSISIMRYRSAKWQTKAVVDDIDIAIA